MSTHRLIYLIFWLFYIFLVSGCATSPVASPPMTAGATQDKAETESNRLGLATSWGKDRTSPVKEVNFTRANPTVPTATLTLYYNDWQGIKAMTGESFYQNQPMELFVIESGIASLSLKSEEGSLLKGFVANNRNYVIGEMGQHYSIVVRNNSANRLEAVLSVDGLDVMDGRPASFSKAGYVIAPYSSLEVVGFRRTLDTVAAFRFGTVQDSYAQRKYGDSRNIGVIGLAIFQEYSPVPPEQELQKRRGADPFPNRFATPP